MRRLEIIVKKLALELGQEHAMEITPEELETCLRVLQHYADANGTLPRSIRFNSLLSKVYRQGKKFDLQAEKKRKETEDRDLRSATVMVQVQRDALPALAVPHPQTLGAVRLLNNPDSCYICKADFTEVHFFYHLLCPKCAEFNYRMRSLSANLTGRTALVTGGRVKIGHQTVLRLLRDGARVIVTTRFPHAAAKRLDSEPDSAEWIDRVQLFGLDLRNIPAVELFASHLMQTESHLDILIHNAAQTIRRPPGFYAELIEQELRPGKALTAAAMNLVVQKAPSTLAISDSTLLLPNVLPSVTDVLPPEIWEDNEELADSRTVNSWLLKLDDVSAPEMLEVQLVNSVAPFLLNSRLKALMVRSPFDRRFIVNVSAVEGQFSRHKTIYHPHTNMAKAALNMMTRTSADDYAKSGIYMNSVDTGWVTDENPTPKRNLKQEVSGFFPPLDIIDGMARIYHPVATGINENAEPIFGKFLKDFESCPW